MAALLAPVVVAGISVLAIDYLRFGSPLTTGYPATELPLSEFTARPLWGILLSPYRGLLFYDPLLFIGLLALPVLIWRRPREAVIAVGLVVVSLILYGTYLPWDAGPVWGPRYLVPIVPYLLWPLLEVWHLATEALRRARPVARRWGTALLGAAAGVLIAASTAIQVLGVTMNVLMYNAYWKGSQDLHIPFKETVSSSPIALALWTLPINLKYALTHAVPVAGYAAADYPFGTLLPTNPARPVPFGAFDIQYFWFTLLPKSALVAVVGALVLGAGMAISGRALSRRIAIEMAGERQTQPSPTLPVKERGDGDAMVRTEAT